MNHCKAQIQPLHHTGYLARQIGQACCFMLGFISHSRFQRLISIQIQCGSLLEQKFHVYNCICKRTIQNIDRCSLIQSVRQFHCHIQWQLLNGRCFWRHDEWYNEVPISCIKRKKKQVYATVHAHNSCMDDSTWLACNVSDPLHGLTGVWWPKGCCLMFSLPTVTWIPSFQERFLCH